MGSNRFKKIGTAIIIITILSIGFSQLAIGINNKDKAAIDENKLEETNEFDVNKIEVSKEVLLDMEKQDKANAQRNIKNYKKLISQFKIPQEYRNEIRRLIKKGYKIPDILTAYEVLYNNYGSIDEIEKLLSQRQLGNSWNQVIKQYSYIYGEFIPSSFPNGYLKELMKDNIISADDVMIADRISTMTYQKTVAEAVYGDKKDATVQAEVYGNIDFEMDLDSLNNKENEFPVFEAVYKNTSLISEAIGEDTVTNSVYQLTRSLDINFIKEIKGLQKKEIFEKLINMKKSGISWYEIKMKIGILNLEESIPRVSIDSTKINKYIEGENILKEFKREKAINEKKLQRSQGIEAKLKEEKELTKEEIVAALVLAEKLGADEEEIINKIKGGLTKEEIKVEYINEKYIQ